MTRETITIKFDYDAWCFDAWCFPVRGAWIATFESYDGPESPIGTGATPFEAVEALLEMAGVEA